MIRLSVRDKDKNSKANKVLKQVFKSNVSTFKDKHIREEIIDHIQTVIMVNSDNDNLTYKIAVEDLEKKSWRKSEHFMKIFYFEIKYLEERYSLSRKAKHFMLELGEFLMWETNLLVDEDNEPLNQVAIAEKLDINVATVRRNMRELIDKLAIYPIDIGKDTYYMMNPYVMFVGQNINKEIPKLFEKIGYKDSNSVNKDGRSNRRKQKESLISLGSSNK